MDERVALAVFMRWPPDRRALGDPTVIEVMVNPEGSCGSSGPRSGVRIDGHAVQNENDTDCAREVSVEERGPKSHLRLIQARKLARLSQYPCSEASIMYISAPHDRRVQFLRPTAGQQ